MCRTTIRWPRWWLMEDKTAAGDSTSEPETDMSKLPRAKHTGPWIDPVCHMEVNPSWGWRASYKGKVYYFCVQAVPRQICRGNPQDFLGDRCMVCRKRVQRTSAESGQVSSARPTISAARNIVASSKADPAAHFMHTMWGIPPWMYFTRRSRLCCWSVSDVFEADGTPFPATDGWACCPTSQQGGWWLSAAKPQGRNISGAPLRFAPATPRRAYQQRSGSI